MENIVYFFFKLLAVINTMKIRILKERNINIFSLLPPGVPIVKPATG